MSIYTCLPSVSVQASTEEFRVKGIQGVKCPPSASGIVVSDKIHAGNKAEYTALRWLRICGKGTPKTANVADYEPAKINALPDFNLPLPRLVLATTKPLSDDIQKKNGLRKYTAGRSKFKNIYTLTTPPTKDSLQKVSRLDLEDDFTAPSGFCTPKSANAFVIIRKLALASLATLPPAGLKESSVEDALSTDHPAYTFEDIVVVEEKDGKGEQTHQTLNLPHGGVPQGINPGQVPVAPEYGYLYFPYFKGMVGSDKVAIRNMLARMAPALDKDRAKALQIVHSLVSVAEKALEGESGRVVAHMAFISELLASACCFGVALCPSREYIGVVGIGSKKLVALNTYGHLEPAVDHATLMEFLNKSSTALQAKERLASLLTDLDLDDSAKEGEEDSRAVTEDMLSSSYKIWYLASDRSGAFESSEQNKRVMLECVSLMDFSEDVRREWTPEGLKDFLMWLRTDDYPYSEDEGSNRFMNIAGIDCSFDPFVYMQGVFGGVSYSPIWPGGKKFSIPAPGTKDPYRTQKEVLIKKGDKVEKEKVRELETLFFMRCSPQQAAKDWRQVFESGAIWQPEKVLTKKEKLSGVIWTGESLETAWEALKANCHKIGKGPEDKKQKKGADENRVVVAAPIDISSMSAF